MRMQVTPESTQRIQTSAEDFHVLFLVFYRNRNSKFNEFKKNPPETLNRYRYQNLIDCSLGHAPPLQTFH